MLYLVATPIGNLKDMTFRAIEILQNCDYILCEDTRHSLKLLSHYQIQKTLRSYHEHNEKQRSAEVVTDLLAGKNIALITDAGSPGISDPGTVLVQACREAGIEVQGIPGACAAIVAISTSGLPTNRFQFIGFLPRKLSELQRSLQEALSYTGTTIFYESPQRIIATLNVINELSPLRIIAVAKELTKTYEKHFSGTAAAILKNWTNEELRGEFILMIKGECQAENLWEELSPQEHVVFLENTYQMSRQDAIKLAAKLRGVSKRDIYNLFHGT